MSRGHGISLLGFGGEEETHEEEVRHQFIFYRAAFTALTGPCAFSTKLLGSLRRCTYTRVPNGPQCKSGSKADPSDDDENHMDSGGAWFSSIGESTGRMLSRSGKHVNFNMFTGRRRAVLKTGVSIMAQYGGESIHEV